MKFHNSASKFSDKNKIDKHRRSMMNEHATLQDDIYRKRHEGPQKKKIPLWILITAYILTFIVLIMGIQFLSRL